MNLQRSLPEVSPAADAKVFIVDSDAMSTANLSHAVQRAGFTVRTFSSAEEYLAAYEPDARGCLVLEFQLPGMSGLELQENLRGRANSPPLIFLTAQGDVPRIAQAIRNGAVDILSKPWNDEHLLARIREALQIDRAIRSHREEVEKIAQHMKSLTDREREVMEYLAAGKSAKEIAQKLEISPKTVDNHRAKVLEKMRVDNPTQLARKLALLNAPHRVESQSAAGQQDPAN